MEKVVKSEDATKVGVDVEGFPLLAKQSCALWVVGSPIRTNVSCGRAGVGTLAMAQNTIPDEDLD